MQTCTEKWGDIILIEELQISYLMRMASEWYCVSTLKFTHGWMNSRGIFSSLSCCYADNEWWNEYCTILPFKHWFFCHSIDLIIFTHHPKLVEIYLGYHATYIAKFFEHDFVEYFSISTLIQFHFIILLFLTAAAAVYWKIFIPSFTSAHPQSIVHSLFQYI